MTTTINAGVQNSKLCSARNPQLCARASLRHSKTDEAQCPGRLHPKTNLLKRRCHLSHHTGSAICYRCSGPGTQTTRSIYLGRYSWLLEGLLSPAIACRQGHSQMPIERPAICNSSEIKTVSPPFFPVFPLRNHTDTHIEKAGDQDQERPPRSGMVHRHCMPRKRES